MGWSQAEHFRLTHGNLNDIVVPGLLWESELAFLVVDGCLSTASYFQQVNAFANASLLPRGFEQTKWMILSRISPVHDQLAAAHFIIWPRLHMNVAKACGVLVAEDRINGRISINLDDETRVINMCVKLETTYGKEGSEPLGELVGSIESDKLVPRWLRGENLNTAIDDIAGARALSAQDLDFLRKKIREQFDQEATGAAKEMAD